MKLDFLSRSRTARGSVNNNMPTIELGYGRDSIIFDYDTARFEVLAPKDHTRPLTDGEIGAAIDNPIGSPPLEDVIAPGDSVLIVASDATRATGSSQIINLLVRRLIQSGVSSNELRSSLRPAFIGPSARL